MGDLPSTTDLIFVQMRARRASGPVPPPEKRFVAGPRPPGPVASLPIIEKIQLRLLAEWAIDTHDLGGFPVLKISCIGHADRDFQRGNEFEQQISERRSLAVKKFLESEIQRLGFDIWGLMQPGFIPVFSRMTFESKGIGSAEHVPAKDEAGRLRNRRVTMIFEKGPSPQRPIQPAFAPHNPGPGPGPGPQPPHPEPGPWFRPIPKAIKLPRSQFEEIIEKFRNSALKYVDVGSVAKATFNALRQHIDPDIGPEARRKAEEEVAKDLDDYYREEQRKRDERNKNPPGDPDPGK